MKFINVDVLKSYHPPKALLFNRNHLDLELILVHNVANWYLEDFVEFWVATIKILLSFFPKSSVLYSHQYLALISSSFYNSIRISDFDNDSPLEFLKAFLMKVLFVDIDLNLQLLL